MVTAAGYAGATFSLLLTVAGLGGAVWSLVAGLPPIMPAATGGIGLIAGAMVVLNDWPRIWKPLLTRKS